MIIPVVLRIPCWYTIYTRHYIVKGKRFLDVINLHGDFQILQQMAETKINYANMCILIVRMQWWMYMHVYMCALCAGCGRCPWFHSIVSLICESDPCKSYAYHSPERITYFSRLWGTHWLDAFQPELLVRAGLLYVCIVIVINKPNKGRMLMYKIRGLANHLAGYIKIHSHLVQ